MKAPDCQYLEVSQTRGNNTESGFDESFKICQGAHYVKLPI